MCKWMSDLAATERILTLLGYDRPKFEEMDMGKDMITFGHKKNKAWM